MERQRLTITLKQDILDKLDATIDGARIRNRSHAIEYHLGKVLGSRIQKALILAGGRGVNMRPFTYEMPKAMIPVHGKPILEHTVTSLRDSGIRNLIIYIGHLGERIKEHFGDGSGFGVSIQYVEEGKSEGTATPLRAAAHLLKDSPFLMLYGDVLIDVDFNEFVDYHLESKALATLAITSVSQPSEYGVVKMHGSKIVEFLQKPERSSRLSHLIFTGVSVMQPKVLDYVPASGSSMLEADVFPQLAKEKKLVGYLFEGQWFDIGTPEVYEQALKEWPVKK
ncbi:MAG: NTP transferase domain-containing protein [Candidatus Nomurabacteria bacterium]|nr:MAG: NTP transferase domain-containing protein [Candidatus Nomurabacteria bacterium]